MNKLKEILKIFGCILLGILGWAVILIGVSIIGIAFSITFYVLMSINIMQCIFYIIIGLTALMLCWALGESMVDKIKYYIERIKIRRKSN